jgi:AmmeMemoRadiSam system protein B
MKWVVVTLCTTIAISTLLFISLSVNLSTSPSKTKSIKGIHDNRFYDKVSFFNGVSKIGGKGENPELQIKSGIIPHHTLPSYILSDFFSRLSSQEVETIILIGPNHYDLGKNKILTSDFYWETPFGTVAPDNPTIIELKNAGIAKIDNKTISTEHSVGGLMPYIKYYLPNANVTPIILKSSTTLEESNYLAQSLLKHIDENTVVIAAVDFSHYLNAKQANINDKVSLDLIKSRNFEKIMQLNNDYVDSPQSIVVLLKINELRSFPNMKVLHNTNSGYLLKDEHIETTSYFSIVYY